MVKLPVMKVGVELEGGFNEYDRHDTNFHTDSSVEIDSGSECSCCAGYCEHDPSEDCYCDCSSGSYKYVGELVSIPLRPDKVHEWIDRNYPIEFDSSCGMHIHLSFRNNCEYSKFVCIEFYNFFIDNIRAWANKKGVKSRQFTKRLNLENSYCQTVYSNRNAKQQLQDCGDRYSIINYCFSRHRTIEIRLSHVWQNKDFAHSYIDEVIHLFNLWLVNQKRAVKQSLKVVI